MCSRLSTRTMCLHTASHIACPTNLSSGDHVERRWCSQWHSVGARGQRQCWRDRKTLRVRTRMARKEFGTLQLPALQVRFYIPSDCHLVWKCWAEALLKIARMTLTIKRDGNWNSFQLANSALPLSVTSSAIAPSARMSREGSKKSALSCTVLCEVPCNVQVFLPLVRRQIAHSQCNGFPSGIIR